MTTTFVLLECGNTAARRPYRNRVSVLRQKMEQRGEVVVPTEDDRRAAWENNEKGVGGQAGIVDQVSFVAMCQLNITEAFTNDKHLHAAGFDVAF